MVHYLKISVSTPQKNRRVSITEKNLVNAVYTKSRSLRYESDETRKHTLRAECRGFNVTADSTRPKT
jgi:hypothetical protein